MQFIISIAVVNSWIAVVNSCINVAPRQSPPHQSNIQIAVKFNSCIAVDPVQFTSSIAVVNSCIAVVVANNTIPVKLNYVSTVNVDGMHSTDFLSW